MKVKKKEEFQDKEGKKVREYLEGGLEVVLLVEPSQWYINTEIKKCKEISERVFKKEEKERKIQDKLREMAEKELEKK